MITENDLPRQVEEKILKALLTIAGRDEAKDQAVRDYVQAHGLYACIARSQDEHYIGH